MTDTRCLNLCHLFSRSAAADLGISIPKTLIVLACGDELTNMIQPFWAIALLGIAKAAAKGYNGLLHNSCNAVRLFHYGAWADVYRLKSCIISISQKP